MLTPEDIKNLIEAQKEVFVTKEEFDRAFNDMKENFSSLQTAVAAFAVTSDKNEQEITVVNHRVDRVETFAKEAAPTIGIKFET